MTGSSQRFDTGTVNVWYNYLRKLPWFNFGGKTWHAARSFFVAVTCSVPFSIVGVA